jgi:hypothetical protein
MELISTVTREIGTGPGVRLHQKVETVTGGYFVARKFVERPPRLRDDSVTWSRGWTSPQAATGST